MSLKTKTTHISLWIMMVFFMSFGVWKAIELDKCRKRIFLLECQLIFSESVWIENLKKYSPIYTDFSHNKVAIQEKTGNKTSVLVYRFSKYMCKSCIQEDLQEIELFQEEIGKGKILLLPAYPDSREGRIELTNVLAKFNYVNIPIDSMLIPSQDGDYMQRYFAVIDKDGNLSMVFFPRREEVNLTRHYLSEVKKIL